MQNTFYKYLKTCLVIFLISCQGESPSSSVAIENSPTLAEACFAFDGKTMVTTDYQGNSAIWDVINNKLLYKIKSPSIADKKFAEPYSQISISRDQKLLITSCGQRLEIWDLSKGTIINNYATNGIIKSFALNNTGEQALIGYNDRTIQLINTKTGSLIWKIKYNTSIEKVALSNDGLYALIALDTGFADLWQVNKNQVLHTFKNNSPAKLIAISPENQYVLIAAPLEPVCLYDLHSGELIHQLLEKNWLPYQLFKRNAIQINTASFSNDLKNLVTSSTPGKVLVWELQTGSVTRQLELHNNLFNGQTMPIILATSYNYDNSAIYALTNNGFVYTWQQQK